MKHIGNDHVVIADAKRGDIGNTGLHYANAFFNHFNCDAITVSPYMGEESIEPFISNVSKGAYVLCRTSNKSSTFIQEDIYSKVISLCEALNNQQNIGLVVGATNDDALMQVRNSTDLPFLIPGIGAQGGDLQSVIKINENSMDTTLINVSRGIIFFGNKDYDSIRNSAKQYLNQLRGLNG
jgi:orotidine-5'-phosphate decarboxylase